MMKKVVGEDIRGKVVTSLGEPPVWTLTVTLSKMADLFPREVVSSYHNLMA